LKIWIDLANSPQVLFFRPVIEELQRRGHEIFITSRPFAQTTQLADQLGLKHTPVGRHGGKKLAAIAYRVLQRSWTLARIARRERCDLAVSHNSYAQALAARALFMPFVTLMDYEHQPANHICFRLARRVMVPSYFPKPAIRKFGATRKAVWYDGLKEQMYLADFEPAAGYLESIGVPSDRTIVVMRPPGDWGLYSGFRNPLFERALEHVASHEDAFVILLPRVASQAESVRQRGFENVWIPPQALDGPNLLYHADLVISGGGTMNREAAILGVPTYSLFKGALPAVDQHLIDTGRMIHITEEEQVASIRVARNSDRQPITNPSLVGQIVDGILEVRRSN
jgi:predicted glycosyltransferase